MKARALHSWDLTYAQARSLQERLATQVRKSVELGPVSLVAGVDMSGKLREGTVRAAAVVVSYPALEAVEGQVVEARPHFPYIPGLLAFREAPVVAAALEKLSVAPDLLLVDGQGLAHPRRFGIACHVGLLFDLPTIGCAKSRLIGSHGLVPDAARTWVELRDNGELIGAVLRPQPGAAPVYVSIGHKVDLETALHWVQATCRGYRLPEPLRLAHLAASGQPLRPALSPAPGMVIQGRHML